VSSQVFEALGVGDEDLLEAKEFGVLRFF